MGIKCMKNSLGTVKMGIICMTDSQDTISKYGKCKEDILADLWLNVIKQMVANQPNTDCKTN